MEALLQIEMGYTLVFCTRPCVHLCWRLTSTSLVFFIILLTWSPLNEDLCMYVDLCVQRYCLLQLIMTMFAEICIGRGKSKLYFTLLKCDDVHFPY